MTDYSSIIPYELIGMFVVGFLAAVILATGAVASIATVLAVWYRAWIRLSNKMYEGYETHPREERPPLWRMRIAAVTRGIAGFQFHKIPAAYRETSELTDDHTTLADKIKETLNDRL